MELMIFEKDYQENADLGLLIAAEMYCLLLITLKIDWASLAPKRGYVETSVTLVVPPPLNDKVPLPPPPPPPQSQRSNC